MRRKLSGVLRNNVYGKIVKKVYLSEPFYLQYLMQKRVIELVIDVDLTTFDIEALHNVHINLKYFRLNAKNEDIDLFNKLLNTNYKNNIINYNDHYVAFKMIGKLYRYLNYDVFVCDRRLYLPFEYKGYNTGVYKGKTILFGKRIDDEFWAIEKYEINRDCIQGNEEIFSNDLIINDGIQVKFNENTINIYIYDLKIMHDKIVVKLFKYGYVDGEDEIHINKDYNSVVNEDYLLYSKLSHKYEKNFFTYEFKVNTDYTFTFENNNYNIRLHAVKNAFNYIYDKNKSVHINGNKIEFKDNQVLDEKYGQLIDSKYNKVILFQDRVQQAGDNAEALYRYVMEENLLNDYECYFVLDEDCYDFQRLTEEGFKLIAFGSELHKKMYINCEMICSSHAAKRIYSPFYNRNYEMVVRYKFVFLQHGVIMGNHQGFLDVLNNKIDLFITSTETELSLVKDFSQYDNVVNTGLARFDILVNDDQDYLLYAPSWNVLYRQDFINGTYYKEVVKVLKLCSDKNFKIKLLLHPEFIDYHHYFNDYVDEYVEIIKPGSVDYHYYLTTCSALITDYSSILWDVLYLEKQLFLHKPYDLHHENDINNEYLDYGYESFDITELNNNIDLFKKSNYNPLFKRDKKCSERIIKEVNKILEGE